MYPSQIKRIFKAYDTMYVVDMSAMMKVKGFEQPKQYDEEGKEIMKIQDSITIPSYKDESTDEGRPQTETHTVLQSTDIDGGFHHLTVPPSN